MSLTTKIVAGCLLFMGALAVMNDWVPAPAVAGANDGEANVFAVQSLAATANDDAEVAFLADGQREGQQSSAERTAGTGRSPEADAGSQASPEAEAGARRSAEGQRGARRSAEGQASREENQSLQGFRPQTQREAALYQMILQLQREVAELRRAVGTRDTDSQAVGEREGDAPGLAKGWEKSKAGGVFSAYDKNGDRFVALDEWLAMTNGNINATRRALQTKRFFETAPGSDKRLSPAEFIRWWNTREGAQRSPRGRETGRSAEAEAGPRRAAEGEGQRRPREAKDEPGRSSERERGN